MTRSFVVSIGVVGLLLCGTALAKPRVAVVAFDGDDNGAVHEVVADLLDGDYQVSASKQVTRTIDKLGLDTQMSDKDLKKLANELEVDAIVRGDLSKSGKRKLLHVKLFVKGKKVRGFKVEFASAQSDKFKMALKDKMDEKLTGAPAKKKAEEAAEPVADDEDPIGSKKTKKTAKADKTETRAEKTKTDDEAASDRASEDTAADADKPAGDDESAGEDDDDDDKAKKRTASADVDSEDIGGVSSSIDLEKRSKGGRSPNTLAVRVELGPSGSSRRLAFNSRAFEQAPKPYDQALVPGMRVGGELYPLAFGNPKSFIAGFGIAGHYDQTVKLNLESSAQPGAKFPVTQKNWGIGARFRIAFGSSAKAPTVTLGGGYFHRMFKVDRTLLMEGNIIDLPDVFYRGYDPGIEFRIPIIKQVALTLGGKALLVTSTGQIQQLYSYGQAKVTAGQGTAGIDIVIANRIGMRITGEFAQYGYKFSGNGELTYNRDLEPGTADVGGAADRYIGGAATLGVLY
jgi:hypothetical protein